MGLNAGRCGLFFCCLLLLAPFGLIALSAYSLLYETHTKTTHLLLRLGDVSQMETEK